MAGACLSLRALYCVGGRGGGQGDIAENRRGVGAGYGIGTGQGCAECLDGGRTDGAERVGGVAAGCCGILV